MIRRHTANINEWTATTKTDEYEWRIRIWKNVNNHFNNIYESDSVSRLPPPLLLLLISDNGNNNSSALSQFSRVYIRQRSLYSSHEDDDNKHNNIMIIKYIKQFVICDLHAQKTHKYEKRTYIWHILLFLCLCSTISFCVRRMAHGFYYIYSGIGPNRVSSRSASVPCTSFHFDFDFSTIPPETSSVVSFNFGYNAIELSHSHTYINFHHLFTHWMPSLAGNVALHVLGLKTYFKI